ncbi:tetratricopeptide repeat protein [bacterium]|nr:tetratricopeptide repeat protein [bacterium]MCI0603773.1 tetratricopeptide repeat protein [bacterium]
MNTATQMIEQGKQELNNLQFMAAGNAFEKALKKDPQSVDARIGLARIRMLKEERKEGARLVEEALKLAPQNAEALALKGVTCMQSKAWKEAVLYLEKAGDADPNLEMTYVNLSKCHRKLGNWKAAEDAARKAIQLNSKSYQAHAELSVVLVKTKRVAAGIKEMIEAIRINPLFLRGYLSLGRLYQLAGKMDLAIRLYENGLKHNPAATPLREELAGAYAFQGDFHSAYRQAVLIAIRRGNDSDWLRVGNCALAIGQFEKADQAFLKSLQKNADSWEAHYNLGELYFTAKLYEKAKEHYRKAIEKDGKSYKPFNGIGLLLLVGERNSAEAQKYFLRALELAPGRKEPLLNMALALADRKVYAEAVKFARATLQVARTGDGIYEQAVQLIGQFETIKQ